MCRAWQWLRACLVVGVVCASGARAHALCDGSFVPPKVWPGKYSVCSAYSGRGACFGPSSEASKVGAALAALSLSGGACKDALAKVLCASLDGWSAHLFDSEGGGAARAAPYLCDAFAREVYAACADAVVTQNPFLVGRATGTLRSRYATASAFASGAGNAATPLQCFSGAPFQPGAGGNLTGDPEGTLCIEKVLDVSMPGGLFASIVPVPGHSSLVALGSLNGEVRLARVGGAGSALSLLPAPLLDWRSKLTFRGERGLLGLAFHKGFASNGRLFVSYSCGLVRYCGAVGSSVVEELRVASPGAEGSLQVDLSAPKKLILNFKQPYANHNGGQVLFSPGPDPHLYALFGDGGSGGDPGQRAQNTGLFFGKVLRLDVDSAPAPGLNYALPADNPFLNTPGVRPEIWALGLRNPWRCSFDAGNAAYLFCGDVGQNAMEEVDLVVRGGNYGWPRLEGTRTYNAGKRLSSTGSLVAPVLTYTHSWNGQKGASVTGGYVYRGSMDTRLVGKYIFADVEGRLMVSEVSGAGTGKFVPIQWFKHACSNTSPLPCNSQRQTDIYSFGEDGANQLYFFSATTGLHRIVSRTSCSP